MTWTERARRFRDLHHAGAPFLLPSVEPLGVQRLASMGFAAAESAGVDLAQGLPITALIEADDVASAVRGVIDAGGVGARIDDRGRELGDALERVRAAVDVSRELVLTARSVRHLEGGSLDETLERLKRFRDAGASVLEAPGLRRAEHIRRLVDELETPIDVTLGLGGVPPSLRVLGELGIARVSTGHVLPALGVESAERAAREMIEHGTFEFLVELEP